MWPRPFHIGGSRLVPLPVSKPDLQAPCQQVPPSSGFDRNGESRWSGDIPERRANGSTAVRTLAGLMERAPFEEARGRNDIARDP